MDLVDVKLTDASQPTFFVSSFIKRSAEEDIFLESGLALLYNAPLCPYSYRFVLNP
jgi:hypothetical protein